MQEAQGLLALCGLVLEVSQAMRQYMSTVLLLFSNCWKSYKEREKGTQHTRTHPYSRTYTHTPDGLIPKWLQQLGLGRTKAGARNFLWVSHMTPNFNFLLIQITSVALMKLGPCCSCARSGLSCQFSILTCPGPTTLCEHWGVNQGMRALPHCPPHK